MGYPLLSPSERLAGRALSILMLAVLPVFTVPVKRCSAQTATPPSLHRMDIFGRFKQHYAHYFLGVIIPAVINGLSVPLLKHFLGAAEYGQYALYFNGLLITNLLICGWLWQAILRFAARSGKEQQFAADVFYLSLLAPLLLFIPVAGLVWYQSGSFVLGLLFAATLLAAALQLPKQSLTQARFLSATIVRAEAVRTLSWFLFLLLISWLHVLSIEMLFTALLLSYGLSTAYLYYKNPLPLRQLQFTLPQQLKQRALPLLKYGLPFSLWYVFFYATTYIDKVIMLRRFGPVLQGNYNALFDFASKGLVLLLAPVLVSASPLLADAYEKGEQPAATRLLRKLIGYELGGMLLCLAGFWIIGYQPLFWLLKIPATPAYVQMGLLIITGTFLWQIALLVQKQFELRLQSALLLLAVVVAFAGQALYYFMMPLATVGSIPWGYVLSAIVYLLLLLVAKRFRKMK